MSCCDIARLNNVLDIGANRGDFLRWILENSGADFTAVEPDASLVENYPVSERVRLIIDRFENATLESASFDLIFCSHTLEHVNSASEVLSRCYELITDNGLLLLEVPNLQAISLGNYVEEFFIDKHTFHFCRSTLIEYCRHIGFSVLSGDVSDDAMNISLLLTKSGGPIPGGAFRGTEEAYRRNSALISGFNQKLQERRGSVKRVCEEMLIPLCLRQKVGFWGAGRIFDTLCKYGGLKAEHVYCLVDGYLWKVAPLTHGLSVERPEALKIYEPQVVVILGNSAEREMSERAYAMGVRHVLKFSELIEQVS